MAVTAGHERGQVASTRSLEAVANFATRSHARAVFVLVIVALLNFLPGFFTIPPVDRDEARFAQASKQMVETGDYIDIRFQDEVRYKKPVGIYWLQASIVNAARALGDAQAPITIWLYRIPSLLGAIGAVLLTYWAALAFLDRRAALLAGLMIAACIVLSVEARLAKTDAMLLMTTVAAFGALARLYLPEQRAHLDAKARWILPGIFWTAVAAGVMLKGPMIAMFLGLAVATLAIIDRSAKWLLALRPGLGLIWVLVLVLPWFIAIIQRSGDSFFAQSIGQDMLTKVASGQESHGAPPGYYLLLFWVTFWPGAPLAALAAPAIWSARREPGAKFLLAWLVPSWVVFEIVMTKLPHYIMPLYPAIAILTAGIVEAGALSRVRWLVWGAIWWFLIPVLIGIAGLTLLLVIGRQFGFLVWPALGAAAVMGLLAWRLYESDGASHSLLRATTAAILTTGSMFGLIVPSVTALFPSVTLANVVRESGCANPRVASVGYEEPSLVFLNGTSTLLTDAARAAEFLGEGQCRFAFIDAREEHVFAERADAIGLFYSRGPRVEAINISNGRPVTIAVFRSGAPS